MNVKYIYYYTCNECEIYIYIYIINTKYVLINE